MTSRERTSEVSQAFDAMASGWPARYQPGGGLTDRLAELTTVIGKRAAPGEYLLDLGCGSGELARSAAATGLRVTACDISSEMIKRSMANDPGGQVRWLHLDPSWSRLPFDSCSFKFAVAASVLEYVPDPSLVFEECYRVLRPGGVFLCTVPDLRHPLRWLEWTMRWPGVLRVTRRFDGLSPDLASYRVYLRLSGQRHLTRWWLDRASRSGLCPIAMPGPRGRVSPLRLLILRRSETEPEGKQRPG